MASAIRSMCDQPLSLIRYPGALGDIPLTVLTLNTELSTFSEKFRAEYSELDDNQFRNLYEILTSGRRSRASLSSHGELFLAPRGEEHNFPHTNPDFVLDHLRRLLVAVDAGVSPPDIPCRAGRLSVSVGDCHVEMLHRPYEPAAKPHVLPDPA